MYTRVDMYDLRDCWIKLKNKVFELIFKQQSLPNIVLDQSFTAF